MKALIEEINEKLSFILSSLESRKYEVEDSLQDVQDKIDDKIEEAKGYKVDVDSAKEEIKNYEDEIASLEKDLSDLTARFSNKDLNAILETGNKEINNQIMNKQKEIAKQREKIAEYTEKARMIKDLLISLKRDKETKKSKLAHLNAVYDYYSEELTRIMNYASENPDDLEERIKEVETPPAYEKYEFNNEPIVDDKPIFDAIESIENDEEIDEDSYNEENEAFKDEEKTTTEQDNIFSNDENSRYELDAEPVEEHALEYNTFDNGINIFNNSLLNNEDVTNTEETIEETKNDGKVSETEESIFDQSIFNEQEKNNNEIFNEPTITEEVSSENEETTTANTDYIDDSLSATSLLKEFNLFSEDEIDENHVHEEDLYKNAGNITDLFNNDSKDSFDSFDFKALSESIDREYENIFGNSEEIKYNDEDDNFASRVETEENANYDFFGNTEPVENFENIETTTESNLDTTIENDNAEEVNNFFSNNNIDFNGFSLEEQTNLKNNFDLISYTKTLDIIRKNNIKLEMLYGAADIFKMAHSELEAIINKLLIAGQNTLNISYVLNALPFVKAIDLTDVINSYGEAIKDANITDLIIKAKHLNELGGNN